MNRVVLLDGGMGQELTHRAPEKTTSLWGMQVMLDHPGMVADVHRDYFEAGATIATTNTYAMHHDRFVGTPQEGRQSELIALALDEADAARRDRTGVRVAGSIGPLVSTYRPETHPAYEMAVPLYAEMVAQIAPRVDLILCETVASLAHARAVLDSARQSSVGKPVWVSVTLDDEDGRFLRSGEPVTALGDLSPDAWLANCSAPEAMAPALSVFATFGRPFGAYANGFTEITKDFLKPKPTVEALNARKDMTPETYADIVLGWVGQGATIVGGCCEIGPAHIKQISRRLTAAGHTII
jgi:homocysteine S-methyltransferase